MNNASEDELAALTANLNEASCLFAMVGREQVEERGTPHLQGFLNLRTKRRLAGVRQLVSPRAHLERARGTDTENDDYCRKGGDVVLCVGEPSAQGRRTDLSAAVDMLRASGGDLSAVAEELPEVFVRYGRGLVSWVDFSRVAKERDFKTRVHVYVGPTGCGKSRLVHAASNAAGSVYYKSRGEWWDGYVGQRSVVIDDFYGWLKHDEMLRICDRYPHRVPVKGAFAQFVACDIYITSNRHVWEWYRYEDFDASALMRRIDEYHVWYEGAPTGTFRPLRELPVLMRYPYGF
nr:MAG: replication-associated protein [Abudefduf bengalensis circovirus]